MGLLKTFLLFVACASPTINSAPICSTTQRLSLPHTSIVSSDESSFTVDDCPPLSDCDATVRFDFAGSCRSLPDFRRLLPRNRRVAVEAESSPGPSCRWRIRVFSDDGRRQRLLDVQEGRFPGDR